MKKFGVLRIEAETCDDSFKVILEVGNKRILNGKLKGNIGLLQLYKDWYKEYLILGNIRSAKPRYIDDGDDGYEPDEDEKTNISSSIDEAEQQDICDRASKSLQEKMRSWLDSLSREIREELIRDIGEISNEYALIVQVSQKNIYKQICQLPWHVWDLLDIYENLEVSLSTASESLPVRQLARRIEKIQPKVEMLAIAGGDSGINPLEDLNLLTRQTKDSLNLTPLLQPDKCTLADRIKSNIGWNILFFAGHSSTNGDGGVLQINKEERVNIIDLRKELETAVENGLRLAIFNSCDGLGLAQGILDAGVPFAIVMRDSIPDRIAQYFLREFIEEYIQQGRSLHTAVRLTRKKLHQEYEATCPGISSLPVIVQHLNAPPPVWHELRGIESPYKGLEPFDESDRSFLFGREQVCKALADLVNDNPVTFIIGEAGSGKTSLVQAGLIPTLKEKKDWIIIKSIATRDYSLLDELYNLNIEVQKYPNKSVLITIDSFEKLFSFEPGKQNKILEKFANIESPANVRILVISKYLALSEDGKFRGYPCLDISNHRLEIIKKESINSIIRKPASLFDVDFEGELSDTIANDINDIANNLPFLQLLLKELWNCTRKDKLITYQAYRDLGGSDGVISKYARNHYDSAFTDEEKEYVQIILMMLVRIDEFDRCTCQLTNKQDLFISSIPRNRLDKLIDELENSRLLRVIVKGENILLEISHQTLLNGWLVKQDWFKVRQETIKSIQWAGEKYWSWKQNNSSKKAKDLLRGKDLDRAKELKKSNSELLSENAISFINYSIKQDASEKTKSKVGWGALSLLAISLFVSWAVVNIPLSNKFTVTKLIKDSENSLQSDTTKSLLLAISAFIRDDSFESQIALWNSFNENHERSQINDLSNLWNHTQFSPYKEGETLTINGTKAVLRNIKNPLDATELIGHQENITYAAFDPNSPNRLITASQDNTAIVWDIKNKVPAYKLTATHSINYAAFNPDNSNEVLTVGANGDAILWNLKALDKPTYLKGHTGEIWMGVFSAKNPKQLLTVSQDSTAKIWNSDRPTSPISLPHNLPVSYGEFSPHDSNIILTRTEREIYIWHSDKPNVPIVLKKHSSKVTQTVFNPSDPTQVISVGENGECFSWNIITGQSTQIGNRIHRVSFYRSGSNELLLLSVGLDQIARLWNVSNPDPQELSHYSLKHPGTIDYITFNPRNTGQILTRSNDKIIRTWNINLMSEIKSSLDKYLNNKLIAAVSVAFSSKEKDRVLSINRDSTLNTWKVQRSGLNNIPVSIDIPKSIGEFETAWFDETNTDRIAIVNTKGLLHLWNHESKQIVRLPQDLGEVVQFAYFDRNNSDRVLLISDHKVGVWNIQKGTILLAPAFLTKYLIINAEFVPNNPNSISILDSNGQMHFWQVGSNKFYNEPIISSPEIINTFKFMPSSSKDILIIYKNQTVESKDINDLKSRPLISVNQERISSIALNDNYPSKLLTGSNSGTVKLWDMAAPQKQLTVEVTKNKSVKSTQLHPSKLNQILTLDADGKVSLHDIGGEELLKASLNNISRCFSEQELKEYSLDRQRIERYFTARGDTVDRIYLDKIYCQGK